MSQPLLRFSNGEVEHRRQEVQQAVKNACDQLRADGVDARNYVEQSRPFKDTFRRIIIPRRVCSCGWTGNMGREPSSLIWPDCRL